jgi:hypothetical protein
MSEAEFCFTVFPFHRLKTAYRFPNLNRAVFVKSMNEKTPQYSKGRKVMEHGIERLHRKKTDRKKAERSLLRDCSA